MFSRSKKLHDVKHRRYSFQRTRRDGSIHYVGFDDVDLAIEWCRSATDAGDTVLEAVVRAQKVRFDVDDKSDLRYRDKMLGAVAVVEDLKRSVRRIYERATFLVFDMSREIDNVASFHLVCDNACTASSESARAVAIRCTARMDASRRRLVDMAVYGRTSFFRIEGSDKYLSGRRKYVLGSSTASEDMRRGLITHTDGCHVLDVEAPRAIGPLAEIDRNVRAVSSAGRNVNVDALSVGTQNLFRGVDYEVRSAKGNVIVLDRLRATMCVACDRVHESENPYILITRGGPMMCCRRSSSHVPVKIYDRKSDGKEGGVQSHPRRNVQELQRDQEQGRGGHAPEHRAGR